MKTTALNQTHRDMNAKMVDFGGWDMPLHYGSQLDEHHKVRSDAGMFDVSHMLAVDIKGEGARDFLRRLVANNVDKLVPAGQGALLLHAQPRRRSDRRSHYLLSCRNRTSAWSSMREPLTRILAWMLAQRDEFAPGLEILPRRDLSMIAVQGPNARARVWQVDCGISGRKPKA